MPKKTTQYDPRLRAVSEALQQVEAPGDYCTVGAYAAFPPPCLVVDSVGDIAVPLSNGSAQALIAASHLAPFGHGEQTLVDTQVRNTWELSAGQFRIANPAFSAFVENQIAEACRVPLGIHASVTYEAKLYKLLLYETGGKFDQHQDSEKESGMFGTLVVVLPGHFEGGKLVVHHPSAEDTASPNTHAFDPATMDPFALKYAAFYGDCPHEVEPVTKGYRLCLTYNLVKAATATDSSPRFGSNHALYETLKTAMDQFFCAENVDKTKRQRLGVDGAAAVVGFDATNPETHRQCKLVYVLTHKYTDANLSFGNLKNRDVAVAASLARYCDVSNGALGLYLCKMEYNFEWRGEEGTMYDSSEDSEDEQVEGIEEITRTVDLQYPWLQYEEHMGGSTVESDKLESFSKGDVMNEVAPCGVFKQKGFKFDGENSSSYTGNEGASSERWYKSATLVVAPLELGTDWALKRSCATTLLEKWFLLADSNVALARAMARAFGTCKFAWQTSSPRSLRVLETAAKLNDIGALCAMFSIFCEFAFQPNVRVVLARFGTTDRATIVKTLDEMWSKKSQYAARNRVNLIASVLHGCSDPAEIAEVLDAVDTVPDTTSEGVGPAVATDSTPEEMARVLMLAMRVSVDRAKEILDTSSLRSLVLASAPAVYIMGGQARAQTALDASLIALANHALSLLESKKATIRNLAFKFEGCDRLYNPCYACRVLRTFLTSHDETATFVETVFEPHQRQRLANTGLLGRLSVEPSHDDSNGAIVVLRKTFESPLFQKTQEAIANISTMVVELVRVAVVSGAQTTRVG
jgi:hypothetical protein